MSSDPGVLTQTPGILRHVEMPASTVVSAILGGGEGVRVTFPSFGHSEGVLENSPVFYFSMNWYLFLLSPEDPATPARPLCVPAAGCCNIGQTGMASTSSN